MATRHHPKQIVSPAGFVRGEDYALVYATPTELSVLPATFAGTMYTTAARHVIEAIARFPGRWGLHLTFHSDPRGWARTYGLWSSGTRAKDARLASVRGFLGTGDLASMLADPPEALLADGTHSAHRMVVPLGEWHRDWRFAADWDAATASPAGGWAAEEARLRRNRDEAMRRAIGFLRPGHPEP